MKNTSDPRRQTDPSQTTRRTILKGIALGTVGILTNDLMRNQSFGQSAQPLTPGAGVDQFTTAVATTTHGPISGSVDKGINVFKGIPYGADTAKYRFMPPKPPTPWTDVLECKKFGPMAPIAGRTRSTSRSSTEPATPPTTQAATTRPQYPMNEDCLHLNIWTPALNDNGKRPVMVYIHGGAYSSGTSNAELYDGVNVATAGNVVVVTMNHRLNVFGYLYLAEIGGEKYADSGNVGMLDLILMLNWVKDNIAQFGGDPGNILIYGQSGGGAKCATLMSMPLARGLFHRVITMSGQQITARETEAATKTTKKVLAKLKITPDNLDALNTVPVDQLIEAMSGNYFGPVKDGRSVARDPFDPDAPPQSADIPMILGNTKFETATLIGSSDPDLFTMDWDAVPAKLEKAIKNFLGDMTPESVVAEYRKMHPDYTPAQVFFAATTAFRSWKGQVIEADRRAKQKSPGGTWVYQLDFGRVRHGTRWAGHTDDIPLCFDNTAYTYFDETLPPDADEDKLAKIMMPVWIAFARTGNPNSSTIPNWPQYTLENRETMLFDLSPQVKNDPRGPERELAAKATYVQPGTRD